MMFSQKSLTIFLIVCSLCYGIYAITIKSSEEINSYKKQEASHDVKMSGNLNEKFQLIEPLNKGWTFSKGNVNWEPKIEAEENEIRINMPEMKNGEYYNYFAKNISVDPNSLYSVSVLTDLVNPTNKDVIRLWDGVNTQYGILKQGSHKHEFLFKTSDTANNLQLALLAANAEGERGHLEITFRNFKFQKVIQNKKDGMPLKIIFNEEYKTFIDASRRKTNNFFDKTMVDFTPSPLVKNFHVPGPYNFTLDDIPVQTEDEMNEIGLQNPIVRKMPYPYYSALSIPSDACATNLESLFYTQSEISRKFGLDLTSSFFIHSDYSYANQDPAFFAQDKLQFANSMIQIEGNQIDRFALLLNSFYRGWIDHLHSWSNGGLYGTPLAPSVVVGCDTNEVVNLDLYKYPDGFVFKGLVINVKISGKVNKLKIVFLDNLNVNHEKSWSFPLQKKPEWEMYHGTIPLIIDFDEEFESEAKGIHFLKKFKISAKGDSNASVEVKAIVPFSITRNMIKNQIKLLKRMNILPVGWSFHGGSSSWVMMLKDISAPSNTVEQYIPVKLGDKEVLIKRDTYGAKKGSPAYCGDIIHDFGCTILNNLINPEDKSFTMEGEYQVVDNKKYFLNRRWYYYKDVAVPKLNPTPMAWMGELGRQIAGFLQDYSKYGNYGYIYTHYNIFPPEAFTPVAASAIYMPALKRFHPYTIEAMNVLAQAKYDIYGHSKPWQRIWSAPFSTISRHQMMMNNLGSHVERKGNDIFIESWKDEVTGSLFPQKEFVTQDLHGATFYLPSSKDARVYIDDEEITSFKRNPKDFTFQESVTIVDTSTPTSVFDEIDFYERNGRVIRSGVSYFFQRRNASSGVYSLEVQANSNMGGSVKWEPYKLNSHETDYLRFWYKKTNPKSRIFISWKALDMQKTEFFATDGDLNGKQGWVIPYYEDSLYHEVILDFADMKPPETGKKIIPRCDIESISFGIQKCIEGDSVFFDRVEFLSARGVRPHSKNNGFVIGGQVQPAKDGISVTISFGNQEIIKETAQGGWFIFENIPKEAVFSLTCKLSNVEYYPARGRLCQAIKNDIEYNIFTNDKKANSIPRAFENIEDKEITAAMKSRSVGAPEGMKKEYGSLFGAHSMIFYAGLPGWPLQYVAEDQANNFGFLDKDRRFENKDNSFRILLLGDCWTEGLQTTVNQHYGTLLESKLRRRLDRNVEVITYATSNATIGTNTIAYEKYGKRFKPNLIILPSTSYGTVTMNGEIQKKIIGWDHKHSPYRMFDFDNRGRLIKYEADEAYPAFTEKPIPVSSGQIPWNFLLNVEGTLSKDAEKAIKLTSEVLSQYYIEPAKDYQGQVIVFYGYYPGYWYSGKYVDDRVSDNYFYQRMENLCNEVGAIPLNLKPHLEFIMKEKEPIKVLTWEQDGHLSPTGNYILSEILFKNIVKILARENSRF